MLIGLTLAVLGAVLSGTGSVLEALGIAALRRTGGSLIGLRRQPLYLIGLAIDILAFLANATALQHLPLFLVQAIVASSVGVTALITAIMGTRLGKRVWLCLGGSGVGLVLLAVSAENGQATTPAPIWRWVMLFAVVPVMLLGLGAGRRIDRLGGPLVALSSGLGYTMVAVSARALPAPESAVSLLAEPLAWAILANGAAAAVLFAMALNRGSVTMVASMVFTAQTVLPAVIGLTLLGDRMRPGLAPVAILGFVLAVSGAVLVARLTSRPRQDNRVTLSPAATTD